MVSKEARGQPRVHSGVPPGLFGDEKATGREAGGGKEEKEENKEQALTCGTRRPTMLA
jgi:hypothetical protein